MFLLLLPNSFDLPSSCIRLLLLLLGMFTKLWKATFGFIMFICLSLLPSIHPSIHSSICHLQGTCGLPLDGFSCNLIFEYISEVCQEYSSSIKSWQYNWYFIPEYTFYIISHSILLWMRNVSDKNCRENHNTHFMFNNFLFKSLALYEILWYIYIYIYIYMVEPDRPQVTIWRTWCVCWKTHTHNM